MVSTGRYNDREGHCTKRTAIEEIALTEISFEGDHVPDAARGTPYPHHRGDRARGPLQSRAGARQDPPEPISVDAASQ